MTMKNCVALLAIAPRRRGIATAFVYGLSLAVRFTSATGEEIEIPMQSLQMTGPVASSDGARLAYQDWSPYSAQPIVFRRGWLPSSEGCRAP